MTDSQKWFGTGKLAPLLKMICQRRYKTSRSFTFPAETRFAGKLLQIRRFLSMREVVQELVTSEDYLKFDFDRDIFDRRLATRQVWSLMERTVKTAGPILLLLRLADSNTVTLSKVNGTVEYIKTLIVDGGQDTLEDEICVAFSNRAPELDCDIANAAYVLDQVAIR